MNNKHEHFQIRPPSITYLTLASKLLYIVNHVTHTFTYTNTFAVDHEGYASRAAQENSFEKADFPLSMGSAPRRTSEDSR